MKEISFVLCNIMSIVIILCVVFIFMIDHMKINLNHIWLLMFTQNAVSCINICLKHPMKVIFAKIKFLIFLLYNLTLTFIPSYAAKPKICTPPGLSPVSYLISHFKCQPHRVSTCLSGGPIGRYQPMLILQFSTHATYWPPSRLWASVSFRLHLASPF